MFSNPLVIFLLGLVFGVYAWPMVRGVLPF